MDQHINEVRSESGVVADNVMSQKAVVAGSRCFFSMLFFVVLFGIFGA